MLFIFNDEVMKLSSYLLQFLQMNFLFVVEHFFHSLEVFLFDHHLEILGLSVFGQALKGGFLDLMLVAEGDLEGLPDLETATDCSHIDSSVTGGSHKADPFFFPSCGLNGLY